jgi:hypothetical protein
VLLAGLHEVADIHCKSCLQLCGWRYVRPLAWLKPAPSGLTHQERTCSDSLLHDVIFTGKVAALRVLPPWGLRSCTLLSVFLRVLVQFCR